MLQLNKHTGILPCDGVYEITFALEFQSLCGRTLPYLMQRCDVEDQFRVHGKHEEDLPDECSKHCEITLLYIEILF